MKAFAEQVSILAKSRTVTLKSLQSVYLQNEGNKEFTLVPLPSRAQLSPINGIVSEDVDEDGHKDMILAGNFYPFRVSIGPMDARYGTCFKRKWQRKILCLNRAKYKRRYAKYDER